MPPIPIHKDAPIKPNDTTNPPQTSDPPPTRTTPASNPATTTTTSSGNPPAPQPGARPIPPTTSPYVPTNANSPPAPQPGATPTLGGGSGGYTATHTTLETRLSAPPPQTTLPPPTDSQLAGRSTTTSTTASKPGPTTLNLGAASSPYQGEHSGGGVVAEPEGRRSLEHPPGYVQASDNQPYGGGLLQGGQGQGGGNANASGGVGEAAWNMLNRAGEALKKGEEAAWRAVRNS